VTSPARRSRAGRWQQAEFACLDFETTGLDPVRDHIISFGIVPIRNGRVVVGERIYREVLPGVDPSPESVKVHGLRATDLRDGEPIAEAAMALHRALDGRFIVAWVAEVEAAFLALVFGRTARWWRRRIIDARVLARSVERNGVADARSYTLSAVAERFGVPVHSPHDALDDAFTTSQVFLVAASMLSSNRPRSARWLLRAGGPRWDRPRPRRRCD
jgi:DNA polymerase-3 subunit epsilon